MKFIIQFIQSNLISLYRYFEITNCIKRLRGVITGYDTNQLGEVVKETEILHTKIVVYVLTNNFKKPPNTIINDIDGVHKWICKSNYWRYLHLMDENNCDKNRRKYWKVKDKLMKYDWETNKWKKIQIIGIHQELYHEACEGIYDQLEILFESDKIKIWCRRHDPFLRELNEEYINHIPMIKEHKNDGSYLYLKDLNYKELDDDRAYCTFNKGDKIVNPNGGAKFHTIARSILEPKSQIECYQVTSLPGKFVNVSEQWKASDELKPIEKKQSFQKYCIKNDKIESALLYKKWSIKNGVELIKHYLEELQKLDQMRQKLINADKKMKEKEKQKKKQTQTENDDEETETESDDEYEYQYEEDETTESDG